MTTKEARERGLELFAFPKMEMALRFAFDHLPTAGVFREETAHFDVFYVAMHPLPAIKKFHERIVDTTFALDHLPEGSH